MSEFSLDHVDSVYFDVLREVGNIGTGNAATSLAQMLNTKVDMKMPRVELMTFQDIGETIGGEDQIMAGILLLVQGDITGSLMFLLEQQSARSLVCRLMGMPEPEEAPAEGEVIELTEMEQSALKEIGNIITASYINSLSMMTNLRITESVPDLTIDMAGAILSVPAIEFGLVGDKMLMIQTAFTDDEKLNGYFILVPDLPSYEKLLKALGVMQ